MDGNKVNPKKKKFLTVTAVSALTVLVAVTGAVVAFMTKTVESRANNFTFVTADVELNEPKWEKEYPENPPVVTPGQTVDKDPTVTNTGETPLYVFLEVKIPCAEVQTVKEDKMLGEKKLTNLLSFTPNTEWIRVSPEGSTLVYENDKDGKEKYSVEVYAYLKELAPKGETGSMSTALFDSVTYADVIEGEPGDRLKFDMPIAVYAIQSENVAEISGTDMKEKLKSAYNTYIKDTSKG